MKGCSLKRVTPFHVACSCGWSMSTMRMNLANRTVKLRCQEDMMRYFNNHIESATKTEGKVFKDKGEECE